MSTTYHAFFEWTPVLDATSKQKTEATNNLLASDDDPGQEKCEQCAHVNTITSTQ